MNHCSCCHEYSSLQQNQSSLTFQRHQGHVRQRSVAWYLSVSCRHSSQVRHELTRRQRQSGYPFAQVSHLYQVDPCFLHIHIGQSGGEPAINRVSYRSSTKCGAACARGPESRERMLLLSGTHDFTHDEFVWCRL